MKCCIRHIISKQAIENQMVYLFKQRKTMAKEWTQKWCHSLTSLNSFLKTWCLDKHLKSNKCSAWPMKMANCRFVQKPNDAGNTRDRNESAAGYRVGVWRVTVAIVKFSYFVYHQQLPTVACPSWHRLRFLMENKSTWARFKPTVFINVFFGGVESAIRRLLQIFFLSNASNGISGFNNAPSSILRFPYWLCGRSSSAIYPPTDDTMFLLRLQDTMACTLI